MPNPYEDYGFWPCGFSIALATSWVTPNLGYDMADSDGSVARKTGPMTITIPRRGMLFVR